MKMSVLHKDESKIALASSLTRLSQVRRGWPGLLVQLVDGFLPSCLFTIKSKALFAGTSGSKRATWPKIDRRPLRRISLHADLALELKSKINYPIFPDTNCSQQEPPSHFVNSVTLSQSNSHSVNFPAFPSDGCVGFRCIGTMNLKSSAVQQLSVCWNNAFQYIFQTLRKKCKPSDVTQRPKTLNKTNSALCRVVN